MKSYRMRLISGTLFVAALLSSCSLVNESYYESSKIYADFDLAKSIGISFETEIDSDTPGEKNFPDKKDSFLMHTFEQMNIYNDIGDEISSDKIPTGKTVRLTETGVGDWMLVSTEDGAEIGYAKDGFMHAIDSDCKIYAELPIEYGQAKTNDDTYVSAYSHLVDIRKYFKVYSSTDQSNDGVDLSQYDLKVSMKLSTNDTSIGKPFYNSNLCLLQYDVLPKLKKAIEKFRADGYTVVIYDAYRPTSVQQKWFDVVRVHKWVADPSIGMGGIHDRGTAIDMSLIDSNGKELEMPTPMHTFTEESARTSETMSDAARKNMDYMLNVMVSCGFTYINSEWWHFQDVDTQHYLPTDHPIDGIPLVASEQ